MKLTWALPLAALLVTLLASGIQGAPQGYQSIGDCPEAQVDSIAGDDDMMFVGRADGYVNAVDRVNGRTLWTYPTAYEPQAGARDLVVDEDRVYVVYTDITNGVEDPVIAIDRDTGTELWRATTSKNDLTKALDPFRIVQDETHVYIGKDGGQVIKLNKLDGSVPKIDGQDAIYTPGNWDTVDSNGIWAMALTADGELYAARNWSNVTDVEVLPWYRNNSIIRLNTDSMAGAEVELTRGGENLNYAVFGLWADDATGQVFVAGASWMGFVGVANMADPGLDLHQIAYSGKNHLEIGDMNWAEAEDPAVVTHFLSVDGDATHVYIGTGIHPDAGSGYAVKLNKADLTLSDWGAKRNLGHGYVRDIDVLDDAVLVGYSCSFTGLGHRAGLAAELPKTLAPVAVLVSPSANELSNGKLDLAVRAHLPTDYLGMLTATFSIAPDGGRCANGDSCYTPLTLYTSDFDDARLSEPFFPNQVALFKNIDISNIPAGRDYVLRVVVEDELGRTATDFAEFGFLADYQEPVVSDLQPLAGSLLTDRRPVISATYRDDLSLVDVGKITLTINDRSVGPLLDKFFDENGIRVDLGDSELSFLGLREGVNNIELVIPDRSGNEAVKTWQLKLDSKVKAPVLSPSTDTFVREVRPILSAQFFEAVQPTTVVFEGQDVTDDVDIIAPQGGLGTRLMYRPNVDLQPGKLYTVTFAVEDEVGNEGGPYKARFRVDAVAPQVANRLPAANALVTEDRPDFRFTLQDAGSGLSEKTVNVFIDGRDVTRDLENSASLYEYTPKAPLQGGKHTITVTAMDVAGNIVSDSWSFTVDVTPPVVNVELDLPPDQTAVKAGDTVVVRATIEDESQIRAVRMDVRALSTSAPAFLSPTPVPGQPGVYELTVQVSDERTRSANIIVVADDQGGLVGRGEASILLDNNPPQTSIKELPAFVGASFELSWDNTPRDDAVGGSGIAFYRVERQLGEGPWQVRFPRHMTTSVVEEVLDGSFTELRYRVFAVDKAGNVQPSPSNVVSTIVRGDPFPTPEFENTLVPGQANLFRATPADDLPLEGGTAFVSLRGADGEVHEFRLDSYGRLFMTSVDLEDLEAGDYLLRYHFRDSQGFEMNSRTYTVQLAPGSDNGVEGLQQADGKESPGLALAPLGGVLGAAMWIARRRSSQ